MKLILNPKEILNVIRYCFENYGLSELEQSDVVLEYSDADYKAAKESLVPTNELDIVCYEDVLMELLCLKKLKFVDYNDDKKEYPFTIDGATANLNAVIAGKDHANKGLAIKDVIDIIDEDGNADAGTAFNVLQLMLYKEIIYG